MKKKKHSPLVVATLAITAYSPVLAEDFAIDTLDLDVTFVGDREVLLQDAHKQLHWPEAANFSNDKPTFSYNVIPKRLNVQPEWTRNGPIRLKINEPLPRLYRGYVNAGMGNFLSPLLQVSYSDVRSRTKSWGVHFLHESTDGGFAGDSIEQGFSSNQLNGWYRKFWKGEAFTASSSYQREHISLYGGQRTQWTDSATFTAPDAFNYQLVTNRVHLSNRLKTNASWKHDLAIQHEFLWNDDAAQEHNFDLSLKVSGLLDTIPVHVNFHANVDRLNRIQEGERALNERQAIVDLHPGIEKTFGPLKTSIGMGLWIDAQGEQPFLFAPEIDASVSLLRDLFVPYVRIDGGIDQNRYRSGLEANPFVALPSNALPDSNKTWNNTYETFHAALGMKGSITKSFSFNLNAEIKRNNQHLFWVQDNAYSDGRSFDPLFQDVTITSLQGDATWNLGKTTALHGRVAQHNYNFRDSITNDQAAWFLPQFELESSITHTIKNKLRLRANLLIQTGRAGLSSSGAEDIGTPVAIRETNRIVGFATELDNIALLDLHAEYLYNARLSGWLKINNVLNQANPFFTGYNNQNFRFQMGASYSF